MVLSGAGERFNNRRDEKVTYILRNQEFNHRFGITSVVAAENELFTAGRDGTIRSWQHPSPSSYHSSSSSPQKCAKSFDEHVDWVNDIVLIPKYERLLSCSSDTSIKVWNINDPSRSLRTLAEHTDYVKALANVQNYIASGSLDGRIFVWDLTTGRIAVECTDDDTYINNNNNNSNNNSNNSNSNNSSSIYCMTGLLDHNILVSGSTDRTVSIWDVRTGERVIHLRGGHSDSVRCLSLSSDASTLLSGSTDQTIKLWDLRKNRYIHSFQSNNGSVWSLTANENHSAFMAGSRHGILWYTDINDMSSTVIVPVVDDDPRSNMILDMELAPSKQGIWVSTTGSSLSLWPLPKHVQAAMDPKSKGTTRPTSNENRNNNNEPSKSPVSSPPPVPRSTGTSSNDVKAKTQSDNIIEDGETVKPLYTIPGLPGIIAYRIMNDRRHVLTCDTESQYTIWDITRGKMEKSLGRVEGKDIDEILKENDVEVSVPSWFHVDIRLGSLLIKLEKSSVANAEIYAIDAGLAANSEETKVNIGEHVIVGMFKKWITGYKLARARRRKELRNNGEEIEDDDYDDEKLQTPAQRNSAARVAELPQYNFPDYISLFVTEDHVPIPKLRRAIGAFDGTENLDLIPKWVVDLVRDHKGQNREVIKISFSLEPYPNSGLPALPTPTLNAPRVLRIRKVSVYIVRELKEAKLTPSANNHADNDGGAGGANNAASSYSNYNGTASVNNSNGERVIDFEIEANHLEILCNDQVLPSTMSLATVRQFKWRSPDDLQLCYRLKSSV